MMFRQLRQVAQSQTLLINEQSRLLQSNNKKVFKFGFGQSPFMPPIFVQEALGQQVSRKDYTSVQGLEEVRKAVAAFHKTMCNIEVAPENVFLAPGSKILIYAILACFEKADFLIPAPAWVSYEPQAHLTDLNPIRIETDYQSRWRVTPENLRQALKHKREEQSIMILNYPGNPDGLSYSEAEIQALVPILEENNVLLISDEIYGLLDFEGNHVSFVNYYNLTITTTGLSKWCGAGGWRLGAALVPNHFSQDFINTLNGVASETYSCAPTPVQKAAEAAYSHPERIQPYLEAQRHVLRQVGTYCHEQLVKIGVEVHAPVGGFYMFPSFEPFRQKLNNRGVCTSVDLCEALLREAGVALLPGTAFGMRPDALVTRLAFVDFDDPLDKATFDLQRDCPRIIEGIQAMVQWLQAL